MEVKRLAKNVMATLAMSLLCVAAFAQGQLTGKVVDTNNEPVLGANVVVVGTTNGTMTDTDGRFRLTNVASGASIEVSFMGYETQVIPVNNRTDISVTLKEDNAVIDEVVVTAYGQVKQAKQVGYATTRVDVSEIERTNSINPVNALQGKVAGVQIDVGGASGITSSSAITIRGAKSVSKNNSPIWVIDGMIIQEDLIGGDAYGPNSLDWGSQLKNLNPADYESVTVLKGAAATALYGSRGANGAIVIVSKGGKMGKRGIGVEISQTFEWTNIYKSPVDFQDVYGSGSDTWYDGGYDGGFNSDGSLSVWDDDAFSWGPRMDGRMINQYLPHGRETAYIPHPDNWKSLYQTGLNSTTNVAVSGGTEKSSFRVSYGYTDSKGVFINNEFNRHNISFRGNTELNKVFSVEMGVQYAFSKALNGTSQGAKSWDWADGTVGLMNVYYVPRNYDIADHMNSYKDAEGKVRKDNASIYNLLTSYLWAREMNVAQRQENSMLADLTLRAHIADWLDASIKGNYNFYNVNTMNKSYPQRLEETQTGWGYSRSGQTSGNYNFVAMLQSNDISLDRAGDFKLSVIAAAELYGNILANNWSKSTNGGFKIPGVFAFSNTLNPLEVGNYTANFTPRNTQTLGVFGILNFAWKDQLFVEVTARNDWLSTLTYPTYVLEGKNNYSVFYPSINASWVFTDTFKLPEWFSMGKLRASLSRVGMGTSAFATVEGYGIYSNNSLYKPDGSGQVNMATPDIGTAFNPDLKPEIQQSMEFGLDLRFFDERLNLDATYYKTNTFNQILNVAGVSEAGAANMMINAGNIQNQGMELSLEGIPVLTKDWRWSIGTNVTLNRGKIVKLHENLKEYKIFGDPDAGLDIMAFEGGAFGVLTSRTDSYSSPWVKWQGEDGDPRNGKDVIYFYPNYSEYIPAYRARTMWQRNQEGDHDRQIVGKVEPDFLLSVNTSLSWKQFDLYLAADGRFGGNYYSNSWKYGASTGVLKSTLNGRDKEHGGLKRINPAGEVSYDGLMLDAVFEEGQQAPVLNPDGSLGDMVDVGGMTYADAVNKLGVAPTTTAMWYILNSGWGTYTPGALQDNTWFALREISLGYRLPEKFCKKFGANYLRLGFTVRNVCYIVNNLRDHLNPASISGNNPLQPVDYGAVPFTRTFSFNLTVRF